MNDTEMLENKISLINCHLSSLIHAAYKWRAAHDRYTDLEMDCAFTDLTQSKEEWEKYCNESISIGRLAYAFIESLSGRDVDHYGRK